MKINKNNLKDIELWLHPKQKGDLITGNEIYQYLKENNLLKDCLTLEDLQEIQKLGLEEFNKHFKDKWVYGWNSVQDRRGRLYVPCLCEYGGEVVVSWDWLDHYWDSNDLALRFSKSSGINNSTLNSDTMSLELIDALKVVKDAGYIIYKEI